MHIVLVFSKINICLTFLFAYSRTETVSLIAIKYFDFLNVIYLGTRIRKNLENKNKI
jgi:hypothetical protein